MSESLRLHRRKDGTITCGNPEPPQTLELSTRWVNTGGIPGVMNERALLEEAGASTDHLNCEPLFDRDGLDIVFEFANHGRCRFEFVSAGRSSITYRLVQED